MDIAGIISGIWNAGVGLFSGLVDFVVSITGIDDRAVGILILLGAVALVLWLISLVLDVIRLVLGLVVAVGIVWAIAHFAFGLF